MRWTSPIEFHGLSELRNIDHVETIATLIGNVREEEGAPFSRVTYEELFQA